MDSPLDRYYRTLNLEPTATPEEVYKAYRDLVRVWDPQRFITQPHLEQMAEAKLKEIIEAYNVVTGKAPAVSAPAAAEPPELLNPVPDHILDRNVANPSFAQPPVVPAEPGQPPEPEPEAEPPRPLSDWEIHRPMSYPKPDPAAAMTQVTFATPPPPPPRKDPLKLATQFGAFLIPILMAILGLIMYDSGPARVERQAPLPAAEATPKAATTPAARAGDSVRHAVKTTERAAAAAPEAAAISLPTGTQLMTPRGQTGAGRFRIANRSGQDAVIRVVSQAAPGSPIRLVYVQADTEVPIGGIPTGVYLVSISLGPMTSMSAPRKWGRPLGPYQFMQVESADGAPQSDEYELILKPAQ